MALLKATCIALRSSPPRVLINETESLAIERASFFFEGTYKLDYDKRLATGNVDLFCFRVRLGVIIGYRLSSSSLSGKCFNLL